MRKEAQSTWPIILDPKIGQLRKKLTKVSSDQVEPLVGSDGWIKQAKITR